MTLEKQIRDELISLSQSEYKKFTASLIPGCDNILGVRIPKIREIAKRIANENYDDYLKNTNEIYFEETMLKALIIGNLKTDIKEIISYSKIFIPKITNWSLCDSFCNELKIIRKHKTEFWDFILPYAKSNKPYFIRTAVAIMLFHFIDDEHTNQMFEIFDNIKHQDYYVKMGIAWAVSICFVKYPNETMKYLKNNKLDDWTYNKSLQKIRESLRIDKKTKDIIKSMKR